ncbi:hypothetical protein [Hydrogenophaga sp.]|jgi:hypothetical protein|uniref:hypothetical protein n=1 Tax=Hydrogenophaga sp. TaxID=1904254 RepID=UPI001D5C8493|nr:hypothetical protein [Hydrogenophaga sp.]MBI2746323.1 hypothetical protein [Burkholderiales bacterium]MDO9146569.1 hypothetical protein [Hydrogenophaga sp.]MDP3627897.1 hypothetical protein [Hydrogenophaga sp.]MDZ4101240.1 hypothetical protein [Hydrogenophaga sp.]MDZ4128822.1 hypothetical protein [Hydrogenophaga sp.]
MTNLKDKLSASVRQAKTRTQPVAPVTAKTGRSPVPTATKATAPKPVAAKPVATQAPTHSGIAFPDRVWPD